MDNGIYRITVESSSNQGASGVAIIKDGKIVGCDDGAFYSGGFEDGSSKVQARITATRHVSYLGRVASSLMLKLTGTHAGSRFDLQGRADGGGNERYSIHGTRLGDIA